MIHRGSPATAGSTANEPPTWQQAPSCTRWFRGLGQRCCGPGFGGRGLENEWICELVRRAPETAVRVVFHSTVIAQLNQADRNKFAATVSSLDCQWVSTENRLMDATGGSTEALSASHFTLSLHGVPLARNGRHGAGLHWLGTGIAGQSCVQVCGAEPASAVNRRRLERVP